MSGDWLEKGRPLMTLSVTICLQPSVRLDKVIVTNREWGSRLIHFMIAGQEPFMITWGHQHLWQQSDVHLRTNKEPIMTLVTVNHQLLSQLDRIIVVIGGRVLYMTALGRPGLRPQADSWWEGIWEMTVTDYAEKYWGPATPIHETGEI